MEQQLVIMLITEFDNMIKKKQHLVVCDQDKNIIGIDIYFISYQDQIGSSLRQILYQKRKDLSFFNNLKQKVSSYLTLDIHPDHKTQTCTKITLWPLNNNVVIFDQNDMDDDIVIV